jgi:hypothetical protein
MGALHMRGVFVKENIDLRRAVSFDMISCSITAKGLKYNILRSSIQGFQARRGKNNAFISSYSEFVSHGLREFLSPFLRSTRVRGKKEPPTKKAHDAAVDQ